MPQIRVTGDLCDRVDCHERRTPFSCEPIFKGELCGHAHKSHFQINLICFRVVHWIMWPGWLGSSTIRIEIATTQAYCFIDMFFTLVT